MSDRIAVMNHGRIEQLDRPDALYARPRTRFVAGFIGESNVIPVSVSDGSVTYRSMPVRIAEPPPADGKYLLIVRPERVRLASAAASSSANRLAATMTDIVYQGDSFICYARLEDGTQIAIRDFCRSDILERLPKPGDAMTLLFEPDELILMPEEG